MLAPIGLCAFGTAVAVTTLRSGGGVLRTACAMVGLLAAPAAGAGVAAAAGFAEEAADFAAALAFAAAGLAGDFGAADFAAGFFAVNLGFSTFFAFAGFETARFVGILCRSRPLSGKGAGLQDAGLYRRLFASTAPRKSRF
jgi:hypothetical protein